MVRGRGMSLEEDSEGRGMRGGRLEGHWVWRKSSGVGMGSVVRDEEWGPGEVRGGKLVFRGSQEEPWKKINGRGKGLEEIEGTRNRPGRGGGGRRGFKKKVRGRRRRLVEGEERIGTSRRRIFDLKVPAKGEGMTKMAWECEENR
jgi:hypothetical protein